jgi:cytochrome c biogenesis protein CcmG, thiol:disulfide interchange protein DsbE
MLMLGKHPGLEKFMKKFIYFILGAILVLIIGFSAFGLFRDSKGSNQAVLITPSLTSPTLESIAPEESIQLSLNRGMVIADFTLSSLTGETIHYSDFAGKPVIINLWATWCTPCKKEMPYFQDAYEKYSDQGLVILGINYTYQQALSEVTTFINEAGLTFPILLDKTGEISSDIFNLQGLPETFFIDPGGMVQHVQIGDLSADELEKYIEIILPQATPVS